MKKILTTIIISLLLCNFSYSKDNPLKIFKKEILGEEAKKKMSLAYDSLTKHNKILKYNLAASFQNTINKILTADVLFICLF